MSNITFDQQMNKFLLYLLYATDIVHDNRLLKDKKLFQNIVTKLGEIHTLMGKELTDPELNISHKNRLQLMRQQQDKVAKLINFFESGNELFDKVQRNGVKSPLSTELRNRLAGIIPHDGAIDNSYLRTGYLNKKATIPIASVLEDFNLVLKMQINSIELSLKVSEIAPKRFQDALATRGRRPEGFLINQVYFNERFPTDLENAYKINYIDDGYIASVRKAHMHFGSNFDKEGKLIIGSEPPPKLCTNYFKKLTNIDYRNFYLNKYMAKNERFEHYIVNILISPKPIEQKQIARFLNETLNIEKPSKHMLKPADLYLFNQTLARRVDKIEKHLAVKDALFNTRNGFVKSVGKVTGAILTPDIIDVGMVFLAAGIFVLKRHNLLKTEKPSVARYESRLKKIKFDQMMISNNKKLMTNGGGPIALKGLKEAEELTKRDIFTYEDKCISTEMMQLSKKAYLEAANEYHNLTSNHVSSYDNPLLSDAEYYQMEYGYDIEERKIVLRKSMASYELNMTRFCDAIRKHQFMFVQNPGIGEAYTKLKQSGMDNLDIRIAALEYFKKNQHN